MPIQIMYLKIPVLLLTLFGIIFVVRRATQKNQLSIWIISVLVCAYFLGKLVQFWDFGPTVSKSYLSDVGFIPTFAYFGSALTNGKITAEVKGKALYWVGFSTMVAIGWEIINMFLMKLPDGSWGPRGDVVDIVIFVIMFTVTTSLIRAVPTEREQKIVVPTRPKQLPSRNRRKSSGKSKKRKVVSRGNR